MRNLWKSELTIALAWPALTWGFSLLCYRDEVFALHNRLLVLLFGTLVVIVRRHQVRQWQVRQDLQALELLIGLVLAITTAIIMIGWMNGSLTLVAIMLLSWVPFACYLWESPLDLWLGAWLDELFPRQPPSDPVPDITSLPGKQQHFGDMFH